MDPQTQNNNDYAAQNPASTTQNGTAAEDNTVLPTQPIQSTEVQPDGSGGMPVTPVDNVLPQNSGEPAAEAPASAEGDNTTQP